MNVPALRRVLLRDLAAMGRELQAYPDDETLWRRVPGLPNPGGVLVRHCCGNLRFAIGAQLGGTGYVRDREAEFATPPVSRAELARLLDAATAEVGDTLARLDPARLGEPFPVPLGGVTLPTGDTLLHLATHLAYHLGQLDYHRRLVTGDARPVDAVSARELNV